MGRCAMGDIGWFQVVCCFSSYTNFITYRRVISLLHSRTHVIDRGHLIFLFKVRQQEKDYCCLVTSPLKISGYFLYSIVFFPLLLFPILCSMSDKKTSFKRVFFKKQSQNTK